jgi:hypothetical protein
MIKVCGQDLLKLLRELEILRRFCGSQIEKRNSRSYMFVIKDPATRSMRTGSMVQKFFRLIRRLGHCPKIREILLQQFPGV